MVWSSMTAPPCIRIAIQELHLQAYDWLKAVTDERVIMYRVMSPVQTPLTRKFHQRIA